MRFEMVIYTPSAPSHGRARGYVRNRNVWVLIIDSTLGALKNIRSRCILKKIRIATEVDSRYNGPNSAYGQAIARAESIVAKYESESESESESDVVEQVENEQNKSAV